MSKKILAFILFAIALLFGASAYAENTCGGQTSTGNPLSCCSNGGNCVWWAWKQAKDHNWVAIPTGNANTWDNTALANPKLYSVSTTPSVGAVGVKESSPYTCVKNGKTVVNGCNTGHVAYITGVKTTNGKVSVDTSQMACGGSYGVTYINRVLGYFDTYIKPISLEGKLASSAGCTGVIVATTTDKNGNKLNLYWSDACKTNWAVVVAKATSILVTATITRSSDKKSYSTNGVGIATSAMVQGTGTACASGKAGGVNFSTICK